MRNSRGLTSYPIVQAVLRLPDATINGALKVTMALSILTILGFGTFYYVDRFWSTAPPIEDIEIRRLEAQVIQDPQNPDARVQVAWGYLDQGMADQAIVQFDEALKLRENYQAALIGKGTAYVQKGDLQAALQPFELIAELNKDNPFKRTLRELQAVYYNLGTIYAQQQKDDQAIASFKEALDIDRADADSLYGLGMAYTRSGALDEALVVLEQAVRLDPVFADGHHALKTIYDQLGMVAHSLVAKGMLSYGQGDFDGALAQFQQAAQVSPNLAEAHQALGIVYDMKGQRTEALAAFQTALQFDSDLPLAQGGVTRLGH